MEGAEGVEMTAAEKDPGDWLLFRITLRYLLGQGERAFLAHVRNDV
jgi:hypothetical protein